MKLNTMERTGRDHGTLSRYLKPSRLAYPRASQIRLRFDGKE